MLLPHKTQHPGCILHIDTGDGVVKSAQFLQNEWSLRRASTLSAGDESGPDEAFEMRVRVWYRADLLEQVTCGGGVVGGETDICPRGRIAGTGAIQHPASVQIDCVLVRFGQCDAGREI